MIHPVWGGRGSSPFTQLKGSQKSDDPIWQLIHPLKEAHTVYIANNLTGNKIILIIANWENVGEGCLLVCCGLNRPTFEFDELTVIAYWFIFQYL